MTRDLAVGQKLDLERAFHRNDVAGPLPHRDRLGSAAEGLRERDVAAEELDGSIKGVLTHGREG